MAKRILEKLGVNPDRLRLEWVSAGEGTRFAEVMNDFSARRSRASGRLGSSEGIAVADLQPVWQTAEAARSRTSSWSSGKGFRVPVRTEEGYREFFGSEAFDDLFDELILDKLVMSRIMGFLRKKPVAPIEIHAQLDLEPAEVARHLQHLTERGLVKFDPGQRLVAAV